MDADIRIGKTQRGKDSVIVRNFEYTFEKSNGDGEKIWRCSKRKVFHCKAFIKTKDSRVVKNIFPEHTHNGNVATALGRKAVAEMKQRMTETVATPSSSRAAVVVGLAPHVQMALPKRSSLSRTLRRHRNKNIQIAGTRTTLPPPPTDLNFVMPERFRPFVLFDSGPGDDRIIMLGDWELMRGLERATMWLADGTFAVVPALYYQLYTIHFQMVGGYNPVGVYCLLTNKTQRTYERVLAELRVLLPNAAPSSVLVDFETAAMRSFAAAFPTATITGCYFHLCQSVIRKASELGLKLAYENDDEVRGFVRCLPALSHVPPQDVVNAFEALAENIPDVEHLMELVTYFEHTYIRGRRLRGNYAAALRPIPIWNEHQSAGDGIARTTNSVEGWHCGLQSLLMCAHPKMWVFLVGMEKDCMLNRTTFLQAMAGAHELGKKTYRQLRQKVANAVASYGHGDTLTYLRAIAHLSHQ